MPRIAMSHPAGGSGRGWDRRAARVSLFLLALLPTLTPPTAAQGLPTCTSTLVTSHITNTSTPHLHLSCSVPPDSTLESGWVWQWDKLPDDPSSSHLPLQNATSLVNGSTYHLPVECGASGQYQSSYLNMEGGCEYSCQFFVEVVEVISEQILDVFERFPNQTSLPPPSQPSTNTRNLSFPLDTANVPLGVCSGRYHLSSGCILDVGHTWFKDGAVFELTPDLYTISVSNSITIRNVTNLTVGYFACITDLPFGLGSYRTEDVSIAISEMAITPTPSPTSPSPTTETTPTDSSEDTLIFGLELWEVGLVVANIVAVLLLFICVCTAVLCLTHRRRGQQPPQHLRLKEERETEVEKEEKGEFVDFSGPSEIPFNAIMFEELLHKGTFKTVHHAFVHHPPSGLVGLEVAVKRLKDEHSELGAQELMAEVYMLKSVHDKAGTHPNFVSLIGVTSYGGPPCLLLEYMPHGTLDRFLWSLKKGPVPEWYLRQTRDTIHDQMYHKHVSCDLMRVIMQVAEGMRFLTEQGFVHRDLSTRNILVSNQMHVKIANPGMFYEGYYYVVSEREHFLHDMAPECLWEKRYSIFSDVWSFGILLYKVVTLETNPYPGLPVRELYDRIVDNDLRPQILSSFSNQLYFLLQRCWQLIPMERPTFPILLNELKQLCSDPTQHVILKTSKDEFTPGYVSENGQVFLHAVPVYVFQTGHIRLSGTQRSNVSSVDDTIYSRETADSLLYLHSEAEGSGVGQETDEDNGIEWPDERSLQGQEGVKEEEGAKGEEVPLQAMQMEGETREHVSLILESNIDEVEANNSGEEGDSHDGEKPISREGSREKLINM